MACESPSVRECVIVVRCGAFASMLAALARWTKTVVFEKRPAPSTLMAPLIILSAVVLGGTASANTPAEAATPRTPAPKSPPLLKPITPENRQLVPSTPAAPQESPQTPAGVVKLTLLGLEVCPYQP